MKATQGGKPIEQKLEKSVEIGTLNAFYGGLLTARQREALRLHYDEDLSLGEISEQFGGTRQNVHELITRSAQKLQRYESVLGGVKRARETVAVLSRASEKLAEARQGALSPRALQSIEEATALIASAISRQEGEETDHGL